MNDNSKHMGEKIIQMSENNSQQTVNQRLNFLIESLEINVFAFSKAIGVGDSTIRNILKGRNKPSLDVIEGIIRTYERVNIEWLIAGIGEPFKSDPEPEPTENRLTIVSDPEESDYTPRLVNGKFQPSKVEIHSITLDPEGRENIHLVSTKAAAGYKTRFIQPEFIRKLPVLSLPFPDLQQGSYRAFQVQGDSMAPGIQNGDYIVAQMVSNWATELSSDNPLVHVIVTKDDVLIKRVVNRLMERSKLVIYSDNEGWPTDEVDGEDVREVWRAKFKLSAKFPNIKFDTRKKLSTLETEMFEIKQLLRKKNLLD